MAENRRGGKPWERGRPSRQPAGLVAGDRRLSGPGHSQVLPRRFRVCPPEVTAAAGEGRLPLRDPTQCQPLAGAEDRPSAPATGGTAVAPTEEVLLQIP